MASRLARAPRLGVQHDGNRRLGAHVAFDLGMRGNRPGEISIGEQGWIEQGAILWAFGGRIRTGRSVYLGQDWVIYGDGGVEIGDEALMCMYRCIVLEDHTDP